MFAADDARIESRLLPGVYARLTALEKLVDGQQDPRVDVLDEDDPERKLWPVEWSRPLTQLSAGEPVLVDRRDAAVVGGWPNPDPAGAIHRTSLDGIRFWDGARIDLAEVDLAVTAWLVYADDTVVPHRGKAPGYPRFWECDGIECDYAGRPLHAS